MNIIIDVRGTILQEDALEYVKHAVRGSPWIERSWATRFTSGVVVDHPAPLKGSKSIRYVVIAPNYNKGENE